MSWQQLHAVQTADPDCYEQSCTGNGASVADAFLWKRYSSTVLDDAVDFVKLSEALGAKAIRVTKMEDVEPALKMALAAEGPVVLDCWIDQDLSVFPMVPAGANLDDVFDEEDMKKHE